MNNDVDIITDTAEVAI